MMKKLALLALLACVCVLPMHADTIISNASTTNATVDLSAGILGAVNPAWFTIPGADWISVANTGVGIPLHPFVIEPNGFTATFTDTFTLSGPIASASLLVLADDTADVTLNGHTLFLAALGAGNTYFTCSNIPVGCLVGTEGIVPSIPLADFNMTGTNTFSVTSYQENDSSFGADFKLTTVPATVSTPEPGTLLMLGSGLIGLIGLGGLRRRSMVG